jgi:hypothetical protein
LLTFVSRTSRPAAETTTSSVSRGIAKPPPVLFRRAGFFSADSR